MRRFVVLKIGEGVWRETNGFEGGWVRWRGGGTRREGGTRKVQ